MTEQRKRGRPRGGHNKPGHATGRQPLYEAPMIVKQISMPVDYWQYLTDELDGGYSAAIRSLVEYHQEREAVDRVKKIRSK